jgi:hypothetical protein
MHGIRRIGRPLSILAVLTALAGRAEAQSCINNGCIVLTNHISSSQLPYFGSSKALEVVVGVVPAAGAKLLAFCDLLRHSLRLPVNTQGQWIQLNSNNSLASNLSICMGAPATGPGAFSLRDITFVSGNQSCNDANGNTLAVLSPVFLGGKQIAISSGGSASVTVSTGDTNGTAQICGGDGLNIFHAERTGFAVLSGFGDTDQLSASFFRGGSLSGGDGDDTLFGSAFAPTSCTGGSGTDRCFNCSAASGCP